MGIMTILNSDSRHNSDEESSRENLMTQSFVLVSSAARRRHPELTPVPPRDRDFNMFSSYYNPRFKDASCNQNKMTESYIKPSTSSMINVVPKRTVSMTRLDQLAKPRQRYLEESLRIRTQALQKTSVALGVSPARPSSSMSGNPDHSTVSSAIYRPRGTASTGGRRPRPKSIAGILPDYSQKQGETNENDFVGNKNRLAQSALTPTTRHSRARSENPSNRHVMRSPLEANKSFLDNDNKPTPPRKPAHVKAAVAASKKTTGKSSKQQQPTSSTPNIGPQVNIGEESHSNEDDGEGEECNQSGQSTNTPSKSSKKEMSEQEYKAILAEKRLQAREQAEREAEREKQAKEAAIREEEERHRREEEEQNLLVMEHLRMQEEKLQKAMQERRFREEEERRRAEEEAKNRAKRDEQEAKMREEAERQRIELEDKLRREEEERRLRKQRVEAIMSRTRKNPNSEKNFDDPQTPDSNDASPVRIMDDSSSSVNNGFQGISLDVRD